MQFSVLVLEYCSKVNQMRSYFFQIHRYIFFKVFSLKVVAGFRFCSKTRSDTFRSVLIYGKEQEPRKKYYIIVQKFHLPEGV